MTTINRKAVGRVGFGMMNLTWRKYPVPDDQAFAVLKAALGAGANLWNGAEFYGTPEANSLQLLYRYFGKYPEDADKVVLSIKGGVKNLKPDGSKQNVQDSIDNCLSILKGRKSIDIWAMARQDPTVPLEETLEAAGAFVKAGKIGGIGISEVTAEQIKANAAIHPIAAVEVELSLHTPDILIDGVATACADLHIPIVAYSPLGRGLLLGNIKSKSDLDPTDIRHMLPRFAAENVPENVKIADEIQRIATTKEVTPAQIAIAWVKAWTGRKGFGPIIPIPGATTVERTRENCATVYLTEAEFGELEQLRNESHVVGARYPAH